MKRLLSLLTAAALAVGLAGAASAQQELRIATEGAYPPFNYFDSAHHLVGFDVDIAKALCAQMKVKCTIVAQDWDGIIPGLLAHKYDAIAASMSITPEREKVVEFTNKYYQTPARFVAPKNTDIKGITPEDMAGKTIGAQSSTTHANYLQDKYKKSNVKLYPTQEEANLDLANGRLDAILADSVIMYEWMQKTDDGKCCKFLGEPVINPQYFGKGVGIALRPGSDALRDKFNAAIAAIRANGTYDKINAKYFPFSVY